MSRSWPTTLRWSACFALAIGLHAAGAAALIARWNESPDRVASAPVIMIDLAPVAVAPQTTPTEVPPDQVESQQQIEPDPVPEKPPEIAEIEPEPEKPVEKVEVEPEPVPEPEPVEKAEVEPEPLPEPERPVEKVEIEPEPVPEPELAMLPPPRPLIEEPAEKKKKEVKKKEVKKKRHRRNSLARAPSTADRKAKRAAAPMAGASARDRNALPNWTSRLVARLERYKRYPSQAQSSGHHGVVRLAFSVDRRGGVHRARIVRSSGSQVLDRETLSMIARASPLPPPPSSVRGSQIAIVVPIRYNIR